MKTDPTCSGGSRGRWRDGRAFTLVEILVASVAASVLLVAVYGIFQRAIKTRDSATERTRQSAMTRRAANVIRNDLRNAYISGTAAVLASILEGGQTNQKSSFPGYLRFTTTTGKDTVDETYGDVQQVEYYIAQDDTGDSSGQASASGSNAGILVRDITRDLLSSVSTTTREEKLLTGVTSLEVDFYDGQTWQPSWELSGSNSTAMVPEAIRVHIQQAAPSDRIPAPMPLEILVPWGTEPVTSATASLTGSSSTL